jgi:hypothetical protein
MKTQLEIDIREMLENDYVTFAELSRIDGFKGDGSLRLGDEDSNIFAWAGISPEAVEVLVRLQTEGVFHFDHHSMSTYLCYMVDGVTLNLPIAKRRKRYAKPHWLPVTLALGPTVELGDQDNA